MSKKSGSLTPHEEKALTHLVHFFGLGFVALLLLLALCEAEKSLLISRDGITLIMSFIVSAFFWFGFIQLRAFKTLLNTDPQRESD
jgi:hypothetical protein